MSEHCIVEDYTEITACGQSVQSRNVTDDGKIGKELYMDDFELAFFHCECGKEMFDIQEVDEHIQENVEWLAKTEKKLGLV